MYKVFINDKEVRFLHTSVETPGEAIRLDIELSAAEIANRVQTSEDNKDRVFYINSEDPLSVFEKFIGYFPIIRAAGGVVRQKNIEGPILMIHRSGKWDLPKGKIDPGESEKEAAVREVEEECGITGLRIEKKLADTHHLYEFRGVKVIKITNWFLMSSDFEGVLQPQFEEGITEVKWINEKDIYFLFPTTYVSIADLLTRHVFKQQND